MELAEALYQKGILSYPRTETDRYPDNFDLLTLIRTQTVSRDWGEIAAEYVSVLVALAWLIITLPLDLRAARFVSRGAVTTTTTPTRRYIRCSTARILRATTRASCIIILCGTFWRAAGRTRSGSRRKRRLTSQVKCSPQPVRIIGL